MTSIFFSPIAASTTVNSVFSSATGAAAAAGTSRDGNRRGGGNAPFPFKQFGKLGRFQHGERGKVVHDFLQISHVFCPSVLIFELRQL